MAARLGSRPRRAAEVAQATVEFALVLPVLFVCIWLGVEASLLLRDQVLVTNAAREAARSSAVGMGPDEAANAGRERTDFGGDVTINITGGGGVGSTTVASARLNETGRLPLLGRLVPTLEVHASVAMRVEGET